jgi:hypothetical protein
LNESSLAQHVEEQKHHDGSPKLLQKNGAENLLASAVALLLSADDDNVGVLA